ncbi:alginate lyase family protein [Microbacterium sp. AK031]|uniref:alginate lyase family protein n=1 Tax=Microbacterium sp. AK031 TaxID=2723076 RepID=UPI0021673B77|nr:alginate lyase family protein [Microbacterium sp. AK031]MCS3844456.1 hypothetical protein [Microbacterium sp. AK031]
MNRWGSSLAAVAAVALVALATPAAAAENESALRDDFDSLAPRWTQAAGAWEASDGVARVTTPGSSRGSILALTDHALDDVSTTTVTFRTDGGGDTAWAGFTFDRNALDDDYTESGYTVLLRNNGELGVIEAAGDGGVTYLDRAATSALPGLDWVTLTVERDGGSLAVTIGDDPEPTLSVSDDTFDQGGFSFAAHRDLRMAIDAVEIDGIVERAEPLPADCIVWSGEPGESGERGDVLNSDERIAAVSARVQDGAEPQASGYQRLMEDVAKGMLREPAPPENYFVPFFYKDPDAHRAARDGLQNDANTAYQLALAYRLTGDASYGQHAAEFLDAWTNTVECVRTSEDSALAFSYHFPAFVYAAELLNGSPVWSSEGELAFAGFLEETAIPVAGSILHRTNNWGSWALELTTVGASYLNDDAGIAAAAERATELLEHQIDPNGHLPEEITRNNGVGDYGIWYTHFSLQPLFLVAETLAAHDIDLFSYANANGVGLSDAVDAASGWVADPESFEFFTGDVADLANVRTVDYLREGGVIAHSMSYFELAQNHFPSDPVAAILVEEGAMTSIHSIPHLSLTHGGLADPGAEEGPGETDPEPENPEGPGSPGTPDGGSPEPGDGAGLTPGSQDGRAISAAALAATGGPDYIVWVAVGLVTMGLGAVGIVVSWRRRAHLN